MSENIRRGFVPTDEQDFADEKIPLLLRAQSDVLVMLDRGYPIKSISTLVGNHYQLSERQRLAIVRATSPTADVAVRQSKKIREVNGGEVFIDGLNIVITLETALSGTTLFECMDGTVRDLAAMRGTYRLIAHTYAAIGLLGDYLEQVGAGKATIYLDAPVSNTGRLKAAIAENFECRKFTTDIQLVPNADVMLRDKPHVITSDAIILNDCQSWLNCAAEIISDKLSDTRVIKLK